MSVAYLITGGLGDFGGGSYPTVQQIRAEMDANSTRLAAIDLATDTLEASMAALPADILAAAAVTPIAANMEQTNGIDLKGDGTAGDKFRSTLVS
ncbi:MAG: hypothetical protein WAW75_02940 [Gallionella sp.]